MRLISLEAENFLKFEHLALEFPDGLTGILGPNGVGKSSLVEAIAWALYGASVSRTRNEGIPFRRTVPCRVVLTLEVEGDEYRVTRELRGQHCTAHAEVAINGVPVEFGTERTNKLLAQRLRMDHRAFMVSFFAKQKEVDALVSWEPRDRKRYILRMLGLEQVERSIEALRRDVADAERDLRARQAALPSLEEVQAARQAARDRVTALTAEVQAARAALDATEAELRTARERLDLLDAQQKRYAVLERTRDLARQALENARREAAIYADRVRDLREKETELASLEPQLEPLAELRARQQTFELAAGLKKSRDALRRTIAEQERMAADLAAQVASLEQEGAKRPEILRAQSQAEETLAQVRAELAEAQAQIRNSELRLTQIKKEGQQLTKELETFRELGQKGKCPTCRRVLNGSYPAVLDHLEGELAALKQEHQEYTGFLKEDSARVTRLQQALEQAEAERRRLELELRHVAQAEARLVEVRAAMERSRVALAQAQAQLAEMDVPEYDAAAHKEVVARVRTLAQVEHRVIGLRHDVERLPAEEHAAETAQAAIPERERALAQAEAELKALNFEPAAHAAQRQHCRALEERREAQLAEFNRVDRERERALVEQQQADARREAYDRQLEEINIRRAEKENRDELLGLMQQFRLHLIGRIRPALSARTSSLVRDLTDGKYDQVELDEDYNLWMYDDGERRELRVFSGGENDLVHLCLRLAISDMIGDAAGGAEHGFLVLDEVLASQDGERRGLILQALARLSRRFRQILMITHLEDMKEMVEHVVELQETPGGSSVVVSA